MNYPKVKRTPDTYKAVYNYCKKHIILSVKDYSTETDPQIKREIRNTIDYYLRRYHQYCIKEKIGAHYIEIGAKDTDFEHLIPASIIRDMVIEDRITIDEALNAPTVKLSKINHINLKKSGWGNKTPNINKPFDRYNSVFNSEFEIHDGTKIDINNWTLEDHFNYFIKEEE